MRTTALVSTILFAALAACGGDDAAVTGAPDRTPGTDTSTADGAGGMPDGSGEADAASDASGDVAPDAPTPDAGADTTVEDVRPDRGAADIGDPCGEVTFTANTAVRPADIVWVIDSSESMDNEIAIVRSNINDFAARIGGSGIDYRVVMVASKSDQAIPIEVPFFGTIPQNYLGVCVPPPLSAEEGCPDTDNPPRFRHPDIPVYSTDALERLMLGYTEFRTSLRREATTNIVVVTDDESSKNAEWFWNEESNLSPPGLGDDLIFHSIIMMPGDGCGDGVGNTYMQLSRDTGGVIQSVCRSDWTPIFDELLAGVLSGAEIPCTFIIPEPEEGFVVNPGEVNVYLTDEAGEQRLLLNVDSLADCGAEGGWYFDDPRNPDQVLICPATCGGGLQGQIDLAFGCETIKE